MAARRSRLRLRRSGPIAKVALWQSRIELARVSERQGATLFAGLGSLGENELLHRAAALLEFFLMQTRQLLVAVKLLRRQLQFVHVSINLPQPVVRDV